jgi:hypothetical protein
MTALCTVASLCGPGTAVATEDAKWSDPVAIDEYHRSVFGPLVERQADGRVVAVWTRQSKDRDRSVWLAWRDPGEAWARARLVSSGLTPGPATHAIVPAGRHSTRIIWSEGDEPAELWTRILRPNGRLGARQPIEAQAAPSETHTMLAAAGPDGAAAVPGVDAQGRSIVLVNDGSSAGWAPLPPLPSYDMLHGLAMGTAGEVVAVVSTERSSTTPVLALTSTGGDWSAEQIGPRPGRSWFSSQLYPAIRADANASGALALAWVDLAEDGAQDHLVVHRAPTGDWDFHALEQPDQDCYAYAHICADLAIDDDGTVAALWQQPAAGDDVDVVISRRDPATGSWGGPEPVVQGVPDTWGDSQADERINIADGGDVVIDWDMGTRHFFQCLAGEECAEAGNPVPPNGYEILAIAAGPRASATMVWTAGCGGTCTDFVYARTLRAAR